MSASLVRERPAVDLPIPHRWRLRRYQARAWHYLEHGGKRLAMVWHRRAGKDELALHWSVAAAMQRTGNYWYMLPEASQARKAIWDAINPHSGKRRIEEVFPAQIVAQERSHDMFLRLKTGSTWQVVGSDNFDSLIGSPPIGLVFSEYAVADPRAWTMLRPILAENGGWAIFPFTPRGRNHGWALRETARLEESWLLDEKTVEQTNVFSSESLESERRELIREHGPDDGEAYFQQEYYVSFAAAVRGAYYARLMERAEQDGRLCGVPYDGAGLVTTAWDIGIGDATSIWFMQSIGRELRAIDYYEASGVPLAHYAEVLKARGYAYDSHILPHDAAARELGTGKSIEELLRSMGFNVRVAPKLPVEQGIQAVRAMLPRIFFDQKKCERGVSALRQYRCEYDEAKRVLRNTPLHDWTSHAADALRMYAVAFREVFRANEQRRSMGWIV